MTDSDSTHVLRWLRANPGQGLLQDDVPGANARELQSLATLGRLAGVLLLSLQPHLTDAYELKIFCGGSDAVVRWFVGDGCPEPPVDIVSSARQILVSEEEDGLAGLYSAIVDARRRRRLGTFFTPEHEVQRMTSAWEALKQPPGSVVDVGAGVGIYTISASRTWPQASVYAVDVNPVTLGLLTLRLAAVAESRNVTPVLADFADWLTQSWGDLPAPRLILGNPPYTRMQLLPEQDRISLLQKAGGLVGRRASLASLMTAISVRMLGPDDGTCLLLPAQWLESDYAVGLRQWLWDAATRKVELRLFASDLFKDAEVDAVSLLVGPAGASPQSFTVCIDGDPELTTIDRSLPSPQQWRAFFKTSAVASNATMPPDLESPHLHDGEAAQLAEGLPSTPSPASGLGSEAPSARAAVMDELDLGTAFQRPRQLGDFASIRRGIATGSNWFFVLTEAQRASLEIPVSSVRPVIRRLRAPQGVRDFEWTYPAPVEGDFENLNNTIAEVAWLLVAGAGPDQPNLASYIDSGRNTAASRSYLSTLRTHWYDLLPLIRDIDVAISPMSKGVFRVLEVPRGYQILNNLYGLTWKSTTSQEARSAILAYMRSAEGQDSLRRAARSQAGGLLKIEPSKLSTMPLPHASLRASLLQ